MFKSFVFLIITLRCFSIQSQNFDDLKFGTDTTFEVVTWNIERFPKNGQTTAELVGRILEAVDADLYALQEIDDTSFMKQVVDDLGGYQGYFKSEWYGGLAYVYKKDEVAFDKAYEIYTTAQYRRPFPRSPLVVEMMFRNKKMVIINNHLKCCGDEELNPGDPWDEETRRRDASVLLDDFIGDRFRNSSVIVLGDLNDVITDAPTHNVFNVFLDNPGDYAFADMDIAKGPQSGWSYPSWPSHIDHILVTNELFDAMSSPWSATKTITPDAFMNNGWWEYDDKVSDHRPVGLRLAVDPAMDIQTSPSSAQDLIIAPNPLINYATCSFPGENVSRTLKIIGKIGTVVREIEVGPDEHKTQLNLSMLPSGIYIVQLSSQSGISLWSKVIKY